MPAANKVIPVEKQFTIHEDEIVKYFDSDFVNVLKKDDRFLSFIPFIVCFTNRSGSNTICEDISNIPGCGYARERLNLPCIISYSKNNKLLSLSDYLYWVFERQNCENPGLKLSIDQLIFLYEAGVLQNCLKNCRFIVTTRRDILEQAISFYIASETKQWTSKHNALKDPPEFNEEKILSIMNNIASANSRIFRFMSLTGAPFIEVVYEDYVLDRSDKIFSIAEFMGCDSKSFSIKSYNKVLKKQSTDLKENYKNIFLDKYKYY